VAAQARSPIHDARRIAESGFFVFSLIEIVIRVFGCDVATGAVETEYVIPMDGMVAGSNIHIIDSAYVNFSSFYEFLQLFQ
jgi:hypothetical protein